MGKSNSSSRIPLFCCSQVVLGQPALWVTEIKVFSCSEIRLHGGAVCSVTRTLNIERQPTGHVKVNIFTVKILCFTHEFMEVKT